VLVASLRGWCRVERRHRDRGAVAVLVALLLGSGVLFGMAALAIDVGNLYAERVQLLNGADAAAVKVAQTCADPTSVTGCDAGLADDYADDNANDGFAAARVCGRGGGLPPSCPSLSGSLADCVRDAPPTGNYAEVHTSTLLPDGTNLLPPVFAQAVLGSGFRGAEVKACARAAWGPPSSANSFALTISACDWNRYTGNGAAFDAVERSFPVYDEATSTTCPVAGGSGNGAGGFRWLSDAGPSCRLATAVARSYRVNTGDSRPNDCRQQELTELKGRRVLVPVFSEVIAGGGSAEYVVSGIAAFVLTGWNLPGAADGPSCANAALSCVYGYFTQAVVSTAGVVGGPDLGARIVVRAG
jgi:hypothetical protein